MQAPHRQAMMRQAATALLGRRSSVATTTSAVCCSLRHFVDAPVSVDPIIAPMATSLSPESSAAVYGDSYTYPLDTSGMSFQLYGETSNFANDDANRIFSSAKVQSYDPSVLYAELRLQEVGSDNVVAGNVAEEHAPLKGEEADTDAVMREGRDKQGAAGAAAVAAAMLESRRAVDGIAMVPGHPLPVVFPRPDGLPPPLRFIKKFGPGGASLARGGRRVTQEKNENDEEDEDMGMYGEVMESEGKVEGHSIQRNIAYQVRVLDEHNRITPVRGFQHFREVSDSLPAKLVQGIASCGYTTPTLVQSAALPVLLSGKDVVGISPNGSGKTVAFAVPSLAVLLRLQRDEARGSSSSSSGPAAPVVVAVAPNRQAVQRCCAMYTSLAPEEVRIVSMYDSAKEGDEQQRLLRAGCDVLVSTPERLMELVQARLVSLNEVQFLAVDEVERMLTDGAKQPLLSIMHQVKENPRHHQVSLWAAEKSPEVERIALQYLAPLTATVIVSREQQTNVNVRHILYPLPSREDRLKAIKKLYDRRSILKRDQVIVYCAYKETAEAVAGELQSLLHAPSSMVKYVHSGLRSRKRNQILNEFKQGDIRILVGTDLGTKRLELPDLEHVIHYDLPQSTEVYAHRSSHVGQAGRPGSVHVLLTPTDARVPMVAKFVEEQTGRKLSAEIAALVERVEADGGEDDWTTPLIRFVDHTSVHGTWRIRGRRYGISRKAANAGEHRTDAGGASPASSVSGDTKHAPPGDERPAAAASSGAGKSSSPATQPPTPTASK